MVANRASLIERGMAAGLAGGLAEILWVSLYSEATGGNAAVIARGVTTAAGLNALLPEAPVTVGIVTHMLLAVALGVALAFAWQWFSVRARSAAACYLFVLACLIGVWTMNFFVILPLLSPPFIALLPYAVSLTSKLLFGLAAAETLRRCAMLRVARMPVTIAVAATGKKRHPAK
jgi:hypothetical protein